jgi:cellulose synthase/poly-beta-1,6-N-acetylglucosamine synthase-like glycosyltransferase
MQWIPAILILPYVFLLLTVFRSLLQIRPFKTSSEPFTFISVVVACHNEQKNLPVLLKSIASQNYPKDLFEVIIVDDNSNDKTMEIAAESVGMANILSISNKGKGKKQALRTGITASKGKLIITTDADCIMQENWIRTIAAFYEINKADMVICPVMIAPVTGFFGRFQELEFLGLQGITAGSASSGKATMCNGANLAFTREVYLNHSDNLHDEINSGDDIFLLHILKEVSGSKILWLESSDALVTTESSLTFRSFLRQRKRWISKVKAYSDRDTIILGIVTFAAILLQLSCLIAGLIYPVFTGVFLVILVLKSVPDFLILLNTSGRYNKRYLMKWFLPAQLIYPFYILCVVLYSLTFRDK